MVADKDISAEGDGDVPTDCPGCRARKQPSPGEVEQIVADYFRQRRAQLADEATSQERLAICRTCPDLRFGTTCRFSGSMVAVRARIAGGSCPALPPRWDTSTATPGYAS